MSSDTPTLPPAPPLPPEGGSDRIPVSIEDEMRSSFMDYAMSVIVARALPDARDGLKPVHRRILFGMQEAGNHWNRSYVKCARIVGEVMGKFHPHGDASIYDALVRMAQDFAMRYTLVDGQGNYGSLDGDPPAAMRYTECRMARLASELLADIDKETVDFQPNYDEKENEPTVLPTRVPNLLVNGGTGIAVGMATNIPPHNLREIIDGTLALLEKPNLGTLELMGHVRGPDFPTGGMILGREGIFQAFDTGRGSVILRGKVHIEEQKNNREWIVIDEIPYMVNKASLVQKIAALVKEKRLEGISDLRDESSREGVRVVIELRKDAVSGVVLNNLYKLTPLQTSFSVNTVAIVEGRPRTLSLRECLNIFIQHRREVVTRRSLYELAQARARLHIVEGLAMAVANIDRVIEIIRASRDPEEARTRLMAEPLRGMAQFLERAGRPAAEVDGARKKGDYYLSELQAKAILEMRLSKLTGLEREQLETEVRELWATIDRLETILGSDVELTRVISDELQAVREQYGDDRRTEIVESSEEILTEDLIADEEMVVTITHSGYVKRSPVTAYRAQKRGGKGVTGVGDVESEADFVAQLFVASTHDHLMMFTNTGRVFVKRVYELPVGRREARGKALVNFLDLQDNERIVAMLPVKDLAEPKYVFTTTLHGTVKRVELKAYANVRSSGMIAVTIEDGDRLISARLTDGESDVLLGTRNGYMVRFPENKVRAMGRQAKGVRGVNLREGDHVVGMEVLGKDATVELLTVCEHGFGKRTALADYPVKGRGGKGVIGIRTSTRNGKVVALVCVSDEDHLIVITVAGKIIRMPVRGIPTTGRAAQGVRLIRLGEGELVGAIERLADPGDDENAPTETVVETLPDDEAEGDGDEPPPDDEGDEGDGDEPPPDDEGEDADGDEPPPDNVDDEEGGA
ncbi:MAG: DNA gyrase subunit A [Deltaproteobacteria bacterium]|nr:DNA gyrase subunit A [Deltaproteobacteria bacterium]